MNEYSNNGNHSSMPHDKEQAGLQQPMLQRLEGLALQLMREQRTKRHWNIFFRLCWFFLAVGTVFLILRNDYEGIDSMPHTALVRIEGVIAADALPNAENIVKALQSAFEDEMSQAVVLAIDSPGGSPVQASIINEAIRRLKQLYPKPVYAVVADVCTSAAYYVAVAADAIYANKASMVGSIGVRLDSFGFTRAMKDLGVERRLFTAGKYKGILDPFSPLSKQDKTKIEAILQEVHEQFIAAVKSGRGNRLQMDNPDLFSGAFWSGAGAQKIGIIDGFGDLGYITREVLRQPEVVDYTLEENIAERLVNRFGVAVGKIMAQTLQAPVLLQ